MKLRCAGGEVFVLLVFVIFVHADFGLSDSGSLEKRTKRGVVFPLGGTFKLVIGLGTPIKLSKTRTITVGWNFQWQYPLAVNTTAIETYPPILSRKTRDDFDVKRREIYEAIESFLSRRSMELSDCLVRYICEEAFYSFKKRSIEPYGDLLHIILSPEDEEDMEISPTYRDAREAGKFGADCFELYPRCDENLLLNGLFSLDFT